MKHAVNSFRFYLATRGLRATLLLSFKQPYYLVQRAVYRFRNRQRLQRIRVASRQFDSRFSVDTHSELSIAELGVANPSLQAYKYGAVSQENFTLAMAKLDIRHEDFVFIDLGSGKGKALLLASDYPFQGIIGVEFSPVLNRIATENMNRYHSPTQRCRNLESICQDAVQFDFPRSPLVIYLYNPFGPELLSLVLDHLESSLASQPRPCMVIMVWPLWARVVRARAEFVEIAAEEYFAVFRHRADPLKQKFRAASQAY